MPKPRPKKPQNGTLYVNGSCLGPAERDPTTGNIESGPHVTARAAVSGMAVLRVDRSPMNPKRWVLTLACNHEVWVTSARKPKRTTSPCATCPTSYPAPSARSLRLPPRLVAPGGHGPQVHRAGRYHPAGQDSAPHAGRIRHARTARGRDR